MEQLIDDGAYFLLLAMAHAELNELEDADDNARYDAPVGGSMELIGGDEATSMLRTFWEKKTSRR